MDPAGELGGAHQAGGKNEGHGGTVPCWGMQGKQNQIQTPSKTSHRRETEKKQPFLGGDPRPVLSPSLLTWSRTGSGLGPGSEHTHLCPERNRQLSGHRAPDNGCVKVQPQLGLDFSPSVSPRCEGLACSPKPSTEPLVVWEADWVHPHCSLARQWDHLMCLVPS